MKIFLSGIVVKGLGIAKKLGFSTINLPVRNMPRALTFGIYAVRVKTKIGLFGGVAHYGPRVFHHAPVSFEVHCFGLKKNLHRRRVSVEIIEKIRRVKNFKNQTLLIKEIRRDVREAKKVL